MSKLCCVSTMCGVPTALAPAHNCRAVRPTLLHAPHCANTALQGFSVSENVSLKNKRINSLSFLTKVYSSKRATMSNNVGCVQSCVCANHCGRQKRSGIKILANGVHAHETKLACLGTSTSMNHQKSE